MWLNQNFIHDLHIQGTQWLGKTDDSLPNVDHAFHDYSILLLLLPLLCRIEAEFTWIDKKDREGNGRGKGVTHKYA